MSRMFTIDGKPMVTWNPQTGCWHNCTYCWARSLVSTRLKNIVKYAEGFRPAFHYLELKRKFKPGDFVAVSLMGDISFIEDIDLSRIRTVILKNPQTTFLFCTKAPAWYFEHFPYPDNLFLGTTIETNRDHNLSRAPLPYLRYMAMRDLDWPKKFLSIEPIIDFDLRTLVKWVNDIKPRIVEVGADNHRNHLPEPPGFKVEALLNSLRSFVPVVVEKEGLQRLKVQ